MYALFCFVFFVCKQKTAYEMRISDWSSDVCSSDLFMETGMAAKNLPGPYHIRNYRARTYTVATNKSPLGPYRGVARPGACFAIERTIDEVARAVGREPYVVRMENMVTPDMMPYRSATNLVFDNGDYAAAVRSEEHTSELQSLMRISYAVFCLKK